MILQSVPSEDYDEEENGLVSNSPRPPATRKLPLKARRVTAADHRISEEDEASWKLVALGICCFLGVVAVGASLAVLSRVGQDAGGTLQGTLGNGATGVKPVLAIFGFTILGEESAEQALPTNNAVAWVAASLLKDHGHLLLSPYAKGEPAFAMPEGSATKGSYIPDGELVQSWRPAGAGRLLRAKASRTSALRAVVVGPISEILQAVILGNILEWYDWTVFGYMQDILKEVFADGSGDQAWLLFAVPFLARPFGSLVFGWIGDTCGRALQLAIWGMAVATALQGVTWMLAALRLLTGLSAGVLLAAAFQASASLAGNLTPLGKGGESAGVNTYMSEFGEEVSGSMAFFLANAVSLAVHQLPRAWGWRIPFLLAVLLRRGMAETSEFRKKRDAEMSQHNPASCIEESSEESRSESSEVTSCNYLPIYLVSWLEDAKYSAGLRPSLALSIAAVAKVMLCGGAATGIAAVPFLLLLDHSWWRFWQNSRSSKLYAPRGKPHKKPAMLAVLACLLGPVAATPLATYKVEARFPHRVDCFTEGLVLNGSEVLESCGLTGKSVLRRYDLSSGQTKKEVHLDGKYFGEGTVELGTSLFVLTYQHKVMLEYDRETLKVTRVHPFPYGEGWGLTTDGCDLLATTGAPYLYRLRRAEDGEFKLVNKVLVKHEGKSLRMLNEVEYVTPKLWVNEWITNRIWRVDPVTGDCERYIDIKKLHPWRGQATPNGIAYSPAFGKQLLLVTGKLWPNMFSLRMSASDLCGGALSSKPECMQAPPSVCHDSHAVADPAPGPTVVATTSTAKPTAPALSQTSLAPTMSPEQGPAPNAGLFSMPPATVSGLPVGFSTALSLLGICLFVVAFASSLLLRYMRRRQRETLHRQVESESDGWGNRLNAAGIFTPLSQVFISIYLVPSPLFMTSLFPTQQRGRGAGLCLGLASVVGGLMPAAASALAKYGYLWPGALISLLILPSLLLLACAKLAVTSQVAHRSETLAKGLIACSLYLLHQTVIAQYGLAAPAVRATSAQTAADAFLDLRQILQEAGGGSSEDGATEAHLVLVAHPHQLPYLALIAVASGFRRVALLDPQLFEAVPWRTFGCSRLGYGGGGAAATVALDQEAHRFESYAGQLKETEPERLHSSQENEVNIQEAMTAFHRNSCA
ncbi:Glutaminyl-peptide cyclotransferase [Symbiodinium microadriaticum]|uniref:Glutaminyl-peptide cyclotransferase n=1 Tax=Symbiodinium microadriaticum TaxID=2951 RepID=A0A1Q9F1V4_SYMMI|nr:Glutaminyl-peptide cyclotransferase [Symbiodinium microadriaticum]